MPKKINDTTILQIKKKSALFLPDRPGEMNMSAYQVKRALASFVTDSTTSVIAEINRIVDEITDEFGNVNQDAIEAIEEQIELLESRIGEAGDSHYIGDDLPDSTKYKIWFSPSDLEEDIEEQVFNLMMKTESSELIIDSPETTEEILLIDKQQEEVLVLDTNAEYAPILVERTSNKEVLVMEKQKEVLVIETNNI